MMDANILSKDEAKRIALNYVRQVENVGDVVIESEKLLNMKDILLYEFKGLARKHAISAQVGYSNTDAITAVRSFEIQVILRDHSILYNPEPWSYTPDPWHQKTYSSPETIYCTDQPNISEPIHMKNPVQDFMNDMADRDLKKAQTAKEQAQADYLKEKAKDIRSKRWFS
jgi:hypothetical protein